MHLGAIFLFFFLAIFACSSADPENVNGEIGIRIAAGDYAIRGQFPYQVSLIVEGTKHRCGGGIIDERFILTAAHCVTDEQKRFENTRLKVAAGITDLNDPKIYLAIRVVKIYILKSYHEQQHNEVRDDIAVLQLKDNLVFGTDVGKLELPKSNENFDYRIAQLAGYGWNWVDWVNRMQTGGSNRQLKYLDVKIIPNENCVIEKDVISHIYTTHLCGQAVQSNLLQRNSGLCNGDSGGPLVVDNKVIGIASLGTTLCQEATAHSRYTRVSSYLQFIKNAMLGIQTTNMMVLSGFDQDIVFPDN